MKRKKISSYTWRKRGHRRRFTNSNVQEGKYTPAADALIHRHNLRKVRPHSRNEPLDDLKPERYAVLSVEQRAVELRRREISISVYIQKAFHHRIEKWNCEWLQGKPDSALSIRVLFYGTQAILIKYDRGVLTHSPLYAGYKLAKRYFDIDHYHGNAIKWLSIDSPVLLHEQEDQPSRERFGNAAKRMQDFTVPRSKDGHTGDPKYDPPVGFGQRRTNSYIRSSPDSLPKEKK